MTRNITLQSRIFTIIALGDTYIRILALALSISANFMIIKLFAIATNNTPKFRTENRGYAYTY